LIDDVAKSLDPSAPIEARGATLMFLPAYSPDLNPIEKAFAKLKQLIRSATQLPSAVPYQVQVRQLATQDFRDFVVQTCARRCLARHSQSDTRRPPTRRVSLHYACRVIAPSPRRGGFRASYGEG
jgi:transposase